MKIRCAIDKIFRIKVLHDEILEYVIGLFHGHANGSHARIRMRVTTQKYRFYMLSICLTEEFVPSLLGIQTPL